MVTGPARYDSRLIELEGLFVVSPRGKVDGRDFATRASGPTAYEMGARHRVVAYEMGVCEVGDVRPAGTGPPARRRARSEE